MAFVTINVANHTTSKDIDMRYVIFSLILAVSSHAMACSYAVPQPPKKAMELAAAVFSGKVTKVERTGQFRLKVTIEIARTWKGTKGKSVEVITAASGAACGYGFKKGESYLVYSHRSKDKDRRPGPLGASLCSRTKRLKAAGEDLKALGEGKKP